MESGVELVQLLVDRESSVLNSDHQGSLHPDRSLSVVICKGFLNPLLLVGKKEAAVVTHKVLKGEVSHLSMRLKIELIQNRSQVNCLFFLHRVGSIKNEPFGLLY